MADTKSLPLNEFLWRNAPSKVDGENRYAPYYEHGGSIFETGGSGQGMSQNDLAAKLLSGQDPEEYLKKIYGEQYGKGIQLDGSKQNVNFMQDNSGGFGEFIKIPATFAGMALGAGGLSGALSGAGAGAGFGSWDMVGGLTSGEMTGLGMGGAFDMGGMGGAMSGASGVASGGGGWLDFFGNGIKELGSKLSQPTGMGNITMGDLLKTGGNFLFNQFSADRANSLMEKVMQQGSALNQSQRQPYQALALDLMQNPQQYMQNNPFATALADRYKNFIIPAQLGKSGNPGMVLDQAGGQFANAISGNYNELANILMGYGGFNQGPGNTGAAAGIGMQGLQNQNEAFRGFGSLAEKGFPDIFKKNPMAQGGGSNPVSGASTIFQ